MKFLLVADEKNRSSLAIPEEIPRTNISFTKYLFYKNIRDLLNISMERCLSLIFQIMFSGIFDVF